LVSKESGVRKIYFEGGKGQKTGKMLTWNLRHKLKSGKEVTNEVASALGRRRGRSYVKSGVRHELHGKGVGNLVLVNLERKGPRITGKKSKKGGEPSTASKKETSGIFHLGLEKRGWTALKNITTSRARGRGKGLSKIHPKMHLEFQIKKQGRNCRVRHAGKSSKDSEDVKKGGERRV